MKIRFVAAPVSGGGGPPPDATFPNEITGGGALRVVDHTPTVTPGTTTEAGGLLNEMWNDPVVGNQCLLVADALMPGGNAIRVRFPAGMWGIPLNYPSAAGAPYYRGGHYQVPVSSGQTHVVAYFTSAVSAARVAQTWEPSIMPSPANGMQFHNFTNVTKYTDRVEFDLLSPTVSAGEIVLACPGHPQTPVVISGSAYQWNQPTKHTEIYVGEWIRSSSGFSNGGNVGTKSLYMYGFSYPGMEWNPAIVGYYDRGGVGDGNDDLRGYATYTNQMAGEPFFNIGGYSSSRKNIADGQAHLIETWLKFESNGSSVDGEGKSFVDGVLEHHLTGLRFWKPGASYGYFNQVKINPIFGGGPATVPAQQDFFFGPLRVTVR